MRKIILIAGLAALAACSKPAEVAPAATETAAAAPAAAETPAAGGYDVTNPDGTKAVTMLNADGTYVDTDAAGKQTAKGKWAMEDGKTCFTPETGTKECYVESARAADGSFTATNAKGEITQVKPQTK